ncbi:GNAT family N-acetyltransferase [uncultured Desulfovibrio sp.]|uniref:GNAT family N-acetyltransferase n=2 Tax=uncultured Desulfovibrio sp. TaxID=167968 RepID=UPI0025E4757F|nr:N-acetyltransferase [uncultured Desulfovibrio sp.]
MEGRRLCIRRETSEDVADVHALVRAAFAAAEHSDGTEQDLVAALRRSGAFLPALSLVAVVDGRLAGHVLFTRAHVGRSPVLALAPLAVLPAYRRQGVGSALVREGHRIGRGLGYAYALVLGDARYYRRFGYENARRLGIEAPPGLPAACFLAARLAEDARPVRGMAVYAGEFGL